MKLIAKKSALFTCKIALAVISVVALFTDATAMSYRFRRYDAMDGLSSNTIFQIYQDRKGYMWFGTSDGLNRFDSREFKAFRHTYDDDKSISNNAVRYLYEDMDDTLWVGTEDGMSIYDPVHEDFTSFPFVVGCDTLSNVFVFSIAEDNRSNLWITTLNNGVFRYDKNLSLLYQYTHDPDNPQSISSNYVSKVYIDAEDDVWFAASGGYLCRYDRFLDNMERIVVRDEKTGARESNLYSMCADSFGRIWLAGRGNGVFMFDKHSGVFTNYLNTDALRLTVNRIHVIEEISPGRLMIGYDEGVSYFNPYKNADVNGVSELTEPKFELSDKFVYAICRDKEGGLWVGTYFGGVNYSSPLTPVFTIYSKDQLQGKVVSKFCEDYIGRVWFGSDDGGLSLFDPLTGAISPVVVDAHRPKLNIHALLLDGQYLWVGAYSDGLYKVDLQTGRTVAHYLTFDGMNPESVYSIYKDQVGQLWVGTKRGIYMHDYLRQSFTSIILLGYNSDILDVCEDEEGNVWFASINKGLICYDQKTRAMRTYTPENSENSLRTNQLRCLAFHKGRLWIGSSGNGLLYYDMARKSFLKAKGLGKYSTIYNIIKDNGLLWLTTNEGLVKYDPESGYVNYYTQEDGLPTKLFNPNSGIRTSSGIIYLGSGEGFCHFNPNDIKDNKVVPRLVFSDFKVFDRNIHANEGKRPAAMDYQRERILSRSHYSFRVNFVVLSYCAPMQNRYRYMLEGFDADWIYTKESDHGVTYTNMSPGRYTLKVMGCNSDETWSEAEMFSVIIPRPLWRSSIMLVLYIMLLGIGFWLIYGFFSRKIKRRHDEDLKSLQLISERELADSKINFFTSVAHEIRTPVTLVSAPIEEILKRDDIPPAIKEDLHLIKKNSDRLITLVNEILEFRQAEERALHSRELNIVELTTMTTDRFKLSAEQRGVRMRMVSKMDGLDIVNIDPEPYVKILSNLLTNALKHTRTKIVIEISSEVGHDCFTLSVTDDGTGIRAEDRGGIFTMFSGTSSNSKFPMKSFGIGLSTVSLLVQKMNAGIEVASDYGEFASFRVTFPRGNYSGQIEKEVILADEASESDLTDIISEKQSILIVEDNPELLNFFSRLFSKNYWVHIAADGLAALDVLKSTNIDLVISDVMMPMMDGNELAGRIRADMSLSHIPIIMLTAKVGIADKIEGLESGADIYVEKPVSSTYLQAQVKSLLEKRTLIRQALESTPFVPLSSVSTNKTNKEFMRRIATIIEENISNQDFSVDDIANAIHLSRSVLYTKLKAISNITPNDFIRLVRLRKAAEYLSQGKYRINEISYLVGFNSASYFTRSFQKQFGVRPKDFLSKKSKDEGGD